RDVWYAKGPNPAGSREISTRFRAQTAIQDKLGQEVNGPDRHPGEIVPKRTKIKNGTSEEKKYADGTLKKPKEPRGNQNVPRLSLAK
ncbi:hypothetical protein KI387_008153, partial [Taxus chinensis]